MKGCNRKGDTKWVSSEAGCVRYRGHGEVGLMRQTGEIEASSMRVRSEGEIGG